MYGAMMLAPDFTQASLGQALLVQAALAEAQMQLAQAQAQAELQAQAQAQAQMMPQAYGALSPFAAAPTAPAPQPAAVAPPAPLGLGALLRKTFPQPIINCWGGVSKNQFDLINAGRTGAALLPFAAAPEMAPQASDLVSALFQQAGNPLPHVESAQTQAFRQLAAAQLAQSGAIAPFAAAPEAQAPQLTLEDLALLQLAALAEQQQMQAYAAEPELAPMFIPPSAQQMLAIRQQFPALFDRSLLPGNPFGHQIGALAGQPPTSARPQMPWQLAGPPPS
jgi:hypothetical protein